MSVYVMGTLDPLAVKVGFTAGTAEQRLASIQRFDGVKIPSNVDPAYIRIFHVFDTADRSLERWLHRRLRGYRIVGEWFAVTPTYVVRLVGRGAITAPPVPAPRQSWMSGVAARPGTRKRCVRCGGTRYRESASELCSRCWQVEQGMLKRCVQCGCVHEHRTSDLCNACRRIAYIESQSNVH